MSRVSSLYLASGNRHKVGELQRLADEAALPLTIHSARELGGMPDVVEDTHTFVGNARKKAVALRAIAPRDSWVMADDSGICVDALDGGPGVESAYFAGPEGDDDANLAKLVETMRGQPAEKRGAHYVCILLVLDGQGAEHVFEGYCHGRLDTEARGGGGFGYDPLFIPRGYEQSFGLLPAETKQQLSHRAAAWREFSRWAAPLLS